MKQWQLRGGVVVAAVQLLPLPEEPLANRECANNARKKPNGLLCERDSHVEVLGQCDSRYKYVARSERQPCPFYFLRGARKF